VDVGKHNMLLHATPSAAFSFGDRLQDKEARRDRKVTRKIGW